MKHLIITILLICTFFDVSGQVCVINKGRPVKEGESFLLEISELSKYEKALKDQTIHRIRLTPPKGISVNGKDVVKVTYLDEVTFELKFNGNGNIDMGSVIEIELYGYTKANKIANTIWRSTLKYPLALCITPALLLGLSSAGDGADVATTMNWIEGSWRTTRPYYLRRESTFIKLGEIMEGASAPKLFSELNTLPISKKGYMNYDQE